MPATPEPIAPMFFFGTLMDREVLSAVLGRAVPDGELRPATLPGWRRVDVSGRSYPMLIPHPTGRVEGVLASGLSRDDRARLDHYEGDEYRKAILMVRTTDGTEVAAGMFLCHPEVEAGKRDWRLEEWRRRHKRAALVRIRALMAGWRPA